MQKKICAVYGEGAVTDWTCQKWFAKFHAGDFLLDEAPRLGRPVDGDSNQIETLIENNQCYATREIVDILKISKSSTENHLHQLGYVHCFDVWVPHKLSEKSLLACISTCDSLLKCNEKLPFLNKLWWAMKSGYCRMEEIVGQVKWTTTSHNKGWSSCKEGDVVYMVGLEGSPLLWAPSRKPYD